MNDESKGRNSTSKATIPGGPYRPSTKINREHLSAIEARQRVTRKLLGHDPDGTGGATISFDEEEYKIVRLIAQEGVISGNEPAIRYKAIISLADFPSTQNFNVLADLARFGEDFYVRGHAMLALGKTGLYAHLPIVVSGLKSNEHFEQAAASRAILTIIHQTSVSAVRAHIISFRDSEILEEFDKILQKAKLEEQRSATPRKTESYSKR